MNICACGVIATRKACLGTLIDIIWVKREVPIRLWNGKAVMGRRWVTYADSRPVKLRIAGWIGALKSGYSDEFTTAITELNRHSRTMAFEYVFWDMAHKRGYVDFA